MIERGVYGGAQVCTYRFAVLQLGCAKRLDGAVLRIRTGRDSPEPKQALCDRTNTSARRAHPPTGVSRQGYVRSERKRGGHVQRRRRRPPVQLLQVRAVRAVQARVPQRAQAVQVQVPQRERAVQVQVPQRERAVAPSRRASASAMG